MRLFRRRKPRPVAPLTERCNITIPYAEGYLVLDILPDEYGPEDEGAWEILIDRVDHDWQNHEGFTSRTCDGFGAATGGCTPDTLLDYWTQDANIADELRGYI